MSVIYCSSGRNSIRPITAAVGIAILGGPVITSVAWSQESTSSGALEEIVVTANKRAEDIQNVPIAVSVAQGEDLTNAGVTGTQDLALRIPSLNFQVSGSGFQPYIRGIGTTAVGAGNENSVATYVDGVYLSNLTGGLLALNSIEQIEVLKGPQGSLFGRNATGGVISITTRTPSQEVSGDFAASYGDYQTISSTGYITGGLGEKLAADLAVYYSDQGEGYGRNLATGHEIGETDDLAARTKWLWTPTDADKVTLAVDYQRTKSTSLSAWRTVPNSTTNFGPGATLAGDRPDLAPYVASGALSPFAVVGDPTISNVGTHDLNASIDPSTKIEQSGASLRIQHDFSSAQILSISAYRDAENHVEWSANPIAAPVQQAGWLEATKAFTQELQLLSLGSDAFQWVAGIFYLNSDVRYDPFFIRGTSLIPLDNIVFRATQGTESLAGFGQLTTRLFGRDDTHLTLGARYTHEKKDIVGKTILTFLPPLDFLSGPVNPTDADETFSKSTFRVAIDHRFNDEWLGYVSYNSGFKSGGYNMIPPGGPDATAVDPELLDAYEIGFKSNLADDRVRLNIAAFYYDWSDLQVTVFNNTTAVTENAAQAELYGLDLDLQARVTERLTISGGLSAVHDEFKDYPLAQYNIPQPISSGGGTVGISQSADGNKLPYTPDYTFNLAADYLAPVGSGQLGFNLTYYYNDGFYSGADNLLGTGSYQLLNGQVEWHFADGRTRVALWGRNLTDDEYATFLSAGTNPGGYRQERDGAPRTYGVTLRYQF